MSRPVVELADLVRNAGSCFHLAQQPVDSTPTPTANTSEIQVQTKRSTPRGIWKGKWVTLPYADRGS
jgi:hypothetical protein